MKREVRSMKGPASLRLGVGGSRLTRYASRCLRAFTLIELLVVIAIMGLLAAIAMPAINKLKPNVMAAATQKLLADVGHARQLAIAHHTTVYMVFVPPGFWNDPAFNQLSATDPVTVWNLRAAQKLADKQMVAYNFVTRRSIGDQPGRDTVRYLDKWRTLPEGAFIPWQKFSTCLASSTPTAMYFSTNNASGSTFPAQFSPVLPFDTTNNIPFPTETAPAYQGHWINLPYIAFNYLGQLERPLGYSGDGRVYIPLSQGSVMVARGPDKAPTPPVPGVPLPSAIGLETPAGNTTNAFNVISIDLLTGRARVERQEVL